ncbi:Hypothetical predicted protein, partial [Pelobates cultripes]
ISQHPEDIAGEFREYYNSLYNPRHSEEPTHRRELSPHIRTYLQDTIRTQISPEMASTLDEPVATDDLAA